MFTNNQNIQNSRPNDSPQKFEMLYNVLQTFVCETANTTYENRTLHQKIYIYTFLIKNSITFLIPLCILLIFFVENGSNNRGILIQSILKNYWKIWHAHLPSFYGEDCWDQTALFWLVVFICFLIFDHALLKLLSLDNFKKMDFIVEHSPKQILVYRF